jgi:carboxyl-terminal processing protease
MMRRDGSVEVDRAPEPPERDRWTGPVATLVDSDTASAAEMIAGALQSYRRGAMVGQRTYGKGCAQEYLDDDARVGVLRLTTLLYALPDGTPVQRVGIEPSIVLPPGPTTPRRPEHEGDMPNAPPTWRGPDVRDRTLERAATAVAWPDHHGSVGPCRDDVVCKALRALGTPTAAVGRTTALTPATSGGGRR